MGVDFEGRNDEVMSINQGVFTSNKSDWETPQELFDELNREFHFDLDVCADVHNRKCEKWLNDSLGLTWKNYGSVCWMNPPYGRQIGDWIQKAYKESQKGVTVVCLLPARTDTRWFHDYCTKGEVRFIKGRLKFSNAKDNAPFPNMIVIFRSTKTEWVRL